MERAVGYVRISQEDETPENQKLAIEKWAREHGLVIVGYFVDEAVSGAVPPRDRPKYKAMLEFTRDNQIKNIVFYDVSRLGRNLEETLYELKRLLEEGFNIYFVYPDFLNQINDPMMKKFVISMFAWFAELYRYDIIQRTKAGLERAKREGKKLGRPEYPFPVDEIKKLLNEGWSVAKIHRYLVSVGKICRETSGGKRDCMKYETFRRKVKELRASTK